MTTIGIIGAITGSIACVVGLFCLPVLLIGLIDHIIESYRRNKYPEYFELYDAAIYESFRIGEKLAAEKRRAEYYIKLYGDGYRDSECTVEHITKKMAQVTKWWINACDEYN